MNINTLVMPFLFTLISSSVLAGSMGPESSLDDWWISEEPCATTPKPAPHYPWEHVVTASIGPALNNNNGKTQTLFLQPDIEKTYATTPTSSALVYGELFLGMQKQLTETYISQFGIAIAGGSDTQLNGDIWEDANPNFNNYSYQYQVDEARVTIKGKMLMDIHYHDLLPYASVDLGVGFNTAHGFTITPDIQQEIAAPDFANNTTTSFTYALGIGLHKKLNDYWQAGIGYEFADWGSSQLGQAPGQTLNEGLSLNHLYINSIQFSLSCTM